MVVSGPPQRAHLVVLPRRLVSCLRRDGRRASPSLAKLSRSAGMAVHLTVKSRMVAILGRIGVRRVTLGESNCHQARSPGPDLPARCRPATQVLRSQPEPSEQRAQLPRSGRRPRPQLVAWMAIAARPWFRWSAHLRTRPFRLISRFRRKWRSFMLPNDLNTRFKHLTALVDGRGNPNYN